MPAASSRTSSGAPTQLDVGAGEERARPRLGPVAGELERPGRPFVDALHVQPDRPHRRPDGRLEREERVRIRPLGVVERALERAEQRLSHSLAVVSQRLRLPDRTPEERLPVLVVGELDGAA